MNRRQTLNRLALHGVLGLVAVGFGYSTLTAVFLPLLFDGRPHQSLLAMGVGLGFLLLGTIESSSVGFWTLAKLLRGTYTLGAIPTHFLFDLLCASQFLTLGLILLIVAL